MAQYSLRDLPPDIWAKFTTRANTEGWPLRPLFLQLMKDYGEGRIVPTTTPPLQLPQFAWLRVHYRKSLKSGGPPLTPVTVSVRWLLLRNQVRLTQPAALPTFDEIPESRRQQILTWLDDTVEHPDAETHLTLRAIAHIGTGPSHAADRHVFQYEVLGLPPGQQAWIAKMGDTWQILRVINGAQETAWWGSFPTTEAALRQLEHMHFPP